MKKNEEVMEVPYREFVDVFETFGLPEIPYRSHISFIPLIEEWKKQANSKDPSRSFMAKEIMRRLENSPQLYEPIEDMDVLREHHDAVDLMISGFFPSLMEEDIIGGLSAPMYQHPFYQSPTMIELMSEEGYEFYLPHDSEEMFPLFVSGAGHFILKECYGHPHIPAQVHPFSVRIKGTPLHRHFRVDVCMDYTRVKVMGELPPLSEEEIKELFDHIDDAGLWLEKLPPEKFEFYGIIYIGITEVTAAETVSQLKRSLLDRNALLSKDKFEGLRSHLCSFFRNPNLEYGVVILDYPPTGKAMRRYRLGHGLLSQKFPSLLSRKLGNSIYRQACTEGETVTILSLSNYPHRNPPEESLLAKGYESVSVTPLFNQKKQIIGLLELASPEAAAFHHSNVLEIQDIAALFGIAVERSREEIDNKIDAIIRNEYTSLHPSLEWRFEENAYLLFEQRERGAEKTDLPPIVFKDVYPLYGQADIVGSSSVRNKAIQADLIDNLYQAKKVLDVANAHCTFPLVGQVLSEIDAYMLDIKNGITSSNEYLAIEFINREVHPLFKELRHKSPETEEAIKDYFSYLDGSLGIVYRMRKDYEDSVAAINSAISEYLEEEQKSAQLMVPHFYEKYQTDGIAYNIYAGKSILKEGNFSRVHLSNLRLWQLITMCRITRKVDALQKKLPIPLTTAQLILVHSAPLSIRFRMDEKRFDVDGTYNARYEIVKKRIDKAYVNGKKERLTLSGKIAIAYQHEEDRQEYLKYLNYLLKEGYIKGEIEELELNKMQGIQGLRALRVEVVV